MKGVAVFSTELQSLVIGILTASCLAQDGHIQTPLAASPTRDDEAVVKVPTDEGDGAEKLVLGPLRVWHIVFLVGLVIVIAVTVFCCCVEWRIPRTRQEIEETYRRRQLNQKYLHQLERTPDVILRNGITHSKEQTATSDNIVTPRTQSTGRRQSQQQHQHQHSLNNISGQTSSHLSHSLHDQRQHHQQQQHHQQTNSAFSNHINDTSTGAGLAVTQTSARLARIANTKILGVQTPFAINAFKNALQKQGRTQRLSSQQQPH